MFLGNTLCANEVHGVTSQVKHRLVLCKGMGFVPMLAESVITAQLSNALQNYLLPKWLLLHSLYTQVSILWVSSCGRHLYLKERTSKLNFMAGICLQHDIEQEVGVACFSPIFTCQSLSQFAQSFLYCPWRKPASIYNTFINLFQTSATEKFTFTQMKLTPDFEVC